jgi:signal transduction histidine kinase
MPSESQRVAVARARAEDRRARHAAFLRPIGVALATIVFVPALQTDPRPSLRGDGLAVTIAIAVFLLGASLIISRRVPARVPNRIWFLLLLGCAGASSVALAWLQPSGASGLGVGLVTYVAASRLSSRDGIVVTVVVALAADLATLARSSHAGLSITSQTLFVALIYLVAVFSRSSREGQENAELLLAQLEDARDAEAVALAEAERTHIARDLHDVLAHSLSALAIQLEGARLLAEREQVSPALHDALERSASLARSGFAEARRAIGTLRGDAMPGPDALEVLVSQFAADTGIEIELVVDGAPRSLAAESGTTLVRAAQEALTNIARHSSSSRATVLLRYEPQAAVLVVENHAVADMTTRAIAGEGSGYGLTAMRERAALVGGSVEAGATEDGFRVTLRVPA